MLVGNRFRLGFAARLESLSSFFLCLSGVARGLSRCCLPTGRAGRASATLPLFLLLGRSHGGEATCGSPLSWPTMGTARLVLIVALALNGALGLGYRTYRYSKGGPKTDVWGQAVLAFFLCVLAAAIGLGVAWLRWAALAFALLFAVVVMPIWVLGVLLPMRPRAIDYTFTVIYWALLVAIGVAAVLA